MVLLADPGAIDRDQVVAAADPSVACEDPSVARVREAFEESWGKASGGKSKNHAVALTLDEAHMWRSDEDPGERGGSRRVTPRWKGDEPSWRSTFT